MITEQVMNEIMALRNRLNICIHGNEPCDITDESCSACMTASPPTESDAACWRFLRSAYARGDLTTRYFAEECGGTEHEVDKQLRLIMQRAGQDIK